MHHPLKIVVIVSTLVFSKLLFAGGPLVIEGPDGHTPVRYQNPNITLNIENGDLGSRSNINATDIVEQAFSLWNDVFTSTINLTTAQLDFDIDINNFAQYIPTPDGSVLNANDNFNPVVYDSDGEIIKAFFGSSNSIAGFAASIYTEFGSYFKEGYAVINGNIPLSDIDLKILVAHEIAHFFGIDHSQTNIDNQESNNKVPFFCRSDIPENYPLMYPVLCRTDGLHADDISAVSALYPAANIYGSYGTLQGRFVDDSGHAILGANIWAENITTGEVVSSVSDYLKQGTGYFKLLLPAGNYTLHANSINTEFYDASSVGPYALTQDDISFTAPHPIAPVDYLGENESSAEIITLSANQTIDINFSSIGKAVVLPENNSGGSGLFALSQLSLLIMLCLLAFRHLLTKLCSPADLKQ